MLFRKNKTLEEKLRLATEGREAGNGEKVQGHPKGGEILVLGDSIIRNVGTDCPDLKVGCFPGIRSEQLQRVIEKRDLGNSNTVVIHVGTNDIKRIKNLDYVM